MKHKATTGTPAGAVVAATRHDRHEPHTVRPRVGKRIIAGLLLLACSGLFATIPFTLMLVNGAADTSLSDAHSTAVARMRKQAAAQEINRAHQYNQRLYEDGSQVIGEATDPWSGGSSSIAKQDRNYQSQLDTPADGIMATIEYPRLGINLPIRHGTDEQTLDNGAGHLYGTSLPVGGVNTHSVISAHSGLANRLMFDKLTLHQGRVGDVFYIKVLDRTLAYKVSGITVVDPNDFSRFHITPGRDEVTLLTCTPYGVNNKRLLVTGERTTMPHPAPNPEDAPKDRSYLIFIAWIAGIWIAILIVTLTVLGVIRFKERKHTK